MSVDLKFVELTADTLEIFSKNTNYEAFNTLFTTPKNWVAYYM